MKVLDRYLTRELALPILYCSLSLVFLILVADLFDNLDDLLRSQTPFSIILKYYVSIIPYAFVQTVPWAAWLGTLFLLVHLGFHHETTAMKAAGLKIMTIVKPILFLGFLIGVGSFLISDKLVPQTFRAAEELRKGHIEKKDKRTQRKEKSIQNLTYYSGGEQLFYIRMFSKTKNEMQGVVGLWTGKTAGEKRQKLTARGAVWKNGQWIFKDVTEYLTDPRGKILGDPRAYKTKTYPDVTFTPEDLVKASSESSFLSYRELKESIEKLRENGVNVKSEMVDLHYRLAAPWQALVMMLLTVPFMGRSLNRRAIAMYVLFCVGTIFAYHLTSAIGVALGKAGKTLPFLSAWFGNIAFAAGALFHMDKANY